jgi:hypothetical protein
MQADRAGNQWSWNPEESRLSHDHRKSLDLAGDDASGRFVAQSGQFPEPGQIWSRPRSSRAGAEPVLYLDDPPGISSESRRRMLDSLA